MYEKNNTPAIYSKKTAFQGIYWNEKRYRNPENAICMEWNLSANDTYEKRKEAYRGFVSRHASLSAERKGFEPLIPFWSIHTFQACLFNHSSTSPFCVCKGMTFSSNCQIPWNLIVVQYLRNWLPCCNETFGIVSFWKSRREVWKKRSLLCR